MITFSLSCSDGHKFESWFSNSDDFVRLSSSHLIECPECGSTKVQKGLMAPAVVGAGDRPLADPMREWTNTIKNVSSDVGDQFVEQVRDMHAGLIPERMVHGTASAADVIALVSDGIPVTALPFHDKSNLN